MSDYPINRISQYNDLTETFDDFFARIEARIEARDEKIKKQNKLF